jgi:AbiJ-like protein
MRDGFNPQKAMVAIKRAIEATFDDGQWQELGYLIGDVTIVQDHPRLLRSLHWGDSDYGGCIFDVLPDLLGPNFKNLQTIERFVGLAGCGKSGFRAAVAGRREEDEA